MSMDITDLYQNSLRLVAVVSKMQTNITVLLDRIEHLEKQVDLITKALPKLGR